MSFQTAHHVHQQPIEHRTSPWFLPEARRNLTLLRAMYGPHSARYRSLLNTYRTVADSLGCRRRLERLAHVLYRQPRRGYARWRPRPRSHYNSLMNIVIFV